MRCLACGARMQLTGVTHADAMSVPGFEQHTLTCSECGDVEQRLVFSRRREQAKTRIEAAPIELTRIEMPRIVATPLEATPIEMTPLETLRIETPVETCTIVPAVSSLASP